jgi:hypothetical protein
LIVLDDHWWIALMPAAMGVLGTRVVRRRTFEQFCEPALVTAAPSLSGDSFILTRRDGTTCDYAVDWHTLSVAFGNPVDCAQWTGD